MKFSKLIKLENFYNFRPSYHIHIRLYRIYFNAKYFGLEFTHCVASSGRASFYAKRFECNIKTKKGK